MRLEGGVHPGPEVGEVGEDVEAFWFGQEAVVGCYYDGGVEEGVV